MAIDIVLSDSASGRPSVRLGPFEDIRLQHRRLLVYGRRWFDTTTVGGISRDTRSSVRR